MTVSPPPKIKSAPSAALKVKWLASENHALARSTDWRGYSVARGALPYGMVQKGLSSPLELEGRQGYRRSLCQG